jgi:CBS domain-containing protein
MARYGRDYGGDFDQSGRGRQERGGRGGWKGQQPGGMRSEGQGGERDRFQGEEGRYGGGYGFDQGFPGGQGASRGGGGYDQGFRGGMGQGGMSGGAGTHPYESSSRSGGYGGRDLGYGNGQFGARGWDSAGGEEQEKQMRAADLMTENPQVVTPDATLAEVAKLMKELDVGIIPVVAGEDNRRLKGVITDRDIAIRAVAQGKDGKTKVSECMTDDVETVNKNDPVRQVLELMQREQVRRVPVTDREGRLVGIIAQADLAVEYAETSHRRLHKVQDTIERISQPTRTDRSSNAKRMAAGNRERGEGER